MGRKKESVHERKVRVGRILARLKKLYPDADCELDHTSALELLVATILSAQTTDENINRLTKALFAKHRTASDYAGADPATLEQEIHAAGFFRQKTKSIQAACSVIADKHHGRVPDTMEQLLELPGVARKTANIVLGTWYRKNEGIAVDTHVGRLAHRLRLTWTSKDEKDAVKIENDLMQLIPQVDWTFFSHALIWHGRRVCVARKPDCASCEISKWCPSAFGFDGKPIAVPGRKKGAPKAKRR